MDYESLILIFGFGSVALIPLYWNEFDDKRDQNVSIMFLIELVNVNDTCPVSYIHQRV